MYTFTFCVSFSDHNIKRFVVQYRTTNHSVPPKLHMLEQHMIPWIKRWRVGTGFHCEQRAKSIHASFNSLLRTYASTQNPTVRLERVVTEHFLKNCPENIARIPNVKK